MELEKPNIIIEDTVSENAVITTRNVTRTSVLAVMILKTVIEEYNCSVYKSILGLY